MIRGILYRTRTCQLRTCVQSVFWPYRQPKNNYFLFPKKSNFWAHGNKPYIKKKMCAAGKHIRCPSVKRMHTCMCRSQSKHIPWKLHINWTKIKAVKNSFKYSVKLNECRLDDDTITITKHTQAHTHTYTIPWITHASLAGNTQLQD